MGCVISREVSSGIVSEAKDDKNLSAQSNRKVDDLSVRKVERNVVGAQNGGIKEEKDGGDGGQRSPAEKKRSRANPRSSNLPKHSRGEKAVVEWPHWLTTACGKALDGLIPRRVDTFRKIDKMSAGYGYGYRSGYSAYNGVPPRVNEWSKVSYDSDDHMYRPDFIDAEGRPIIVSIPGHYGQSYVAKVETVVEHVRVPVFTQYRNDSPPKDYGYSTYSSPTKIEPLKIHGRPSSPPKVQPGKMYTRPMNSPPKVQPGKMYARPISPPKVQPVRDYGYRRHSSPPKVEQVKDYRYKAEPMKDYVYKADQPVKDYGYKTEPVRDYGYKAEPVRDYGYKVDQPVKDYGYKAEPVRDYGYKADQPVKDYGYKAEPVKDCGYKTGPVFGKSEPEHGSDKWRRPTSPAHEDHPQEVEEFISKVQTEASRPKNRFPINAANWRQMAPTSNGNNGTTGYGDNSNKDDYYRKNDAAMEPNMVTNGGWARPNRSAWQAAPTSNTRDATLGKPTSDIATAMENLKEAATALSITTVLKGEAYPETIDSREAARRYGNMNTTFRPETTDKPTISSRDAAKKYGGAIL